MKIRMCMVLLSVLVFIACKDQVEYVRQPAESSATLEMIWLNGDSISEFDRYTLEYAYPLPLTAAIPRLDYRQSHPYSNVEVDMPERLPGTITINVESENTYNSRTYRIHLNESAKDPDTIIFYDLAIHKGDTGIITPYYNMSSPGGPVVPNSKWLIDTIPLRIPSGQFYQPGWHFIFSFDHNPNEYDEIRIEGSDSSYKSIGNPSSIYINNDLRLYQSNAVLVEDTFNIDLKSHYLSWNKRTTISMAFHFKAEYQELKIYGIKY